MSIITIKRVIIRVIVLKRIIIRIIVYKNEKNIKYFDIPAKITSKSRLK